MVNYLHSIGLRLRVSLWDADEILSRRIYKGDEEWETIPTKTVKIAFNMKVFNIEDTGLRLPVSYTLVVTGLSLAVRHMHPRQTMYPRSNFQSVYLRF